MSAVRVSRASELELGRAAADENEDGRCEEEGEGVELVEEGVELSSFFTGGFVLF